MFLVVSLQHPRGPWRPRGCRGPRVAALQIYIKPANGQSRGPLFCLRWPPAGAFLPPGRWPLASPQLLCVRKSALGVGRARPLLAAPRRFLSCQTAAAVGQTAVGARYFLPDGHDFCQLAHAAATFAPAPPGGRPAGVIVFCNFARRGSRGASRRGRAADAVTQGFAHY